MSDKFPDTNKGSEESAGLSEEEFNGLLSDDETQQSLHRFAYRYIGDREEAAEIVQESLLKGWRARENFRGDSKPETWLHTIVRNTALTARERKYGRNVIVLPLLDNENPSESFVSDERVEHDVVERVYGEEVFGKVKSKIDMLSPTLKSVLVLAAAGLAHKAIARRLEISEPAAKTRLHRARVNLKHLLESD